MKKISVIFGAVLALAVVFLTGCDMNTFDEFTGKNTWLVKDIEYKDSNNIISVLTAHIYYSNSAYTSDKLKSGVTVPAGLTIILTASTDNQSTAANAIGTILGTKKYVMKTYEYGKTFAESSSEAGDSGNLGSLSSLSINDKTWTTAYLALKTAGKGVESNGSNCPDPIRSGKGYSELSWDTIKGSMSWKTIVLSLLSK